MKRVTQYLGIFLAVIFLFSMISSCSYIDSLGLNKDISKYGQTKTVSKSKISSSISSKWGSFKFTSKQIKKIKKLKKSTTFKKNTYTTKRTVKGKTIYMSITKVSNSKYQIIMATIKF